MDSLEDRLVEVVADAVREALRPHLARLDQLAAESRPERLHYTEEEAAELLAVAPSNAGSGPGRVEALSDNETASFDAAAFRQRSV